MKTHHYILFSTLAFIILFYKENAGINLGILGIVFAIFALIKTPERNRNKIFILLFATSILSSVAFAWFGDISSFFALTVSLLLLSFKSKTRKLKTLFLLPVFATNCFTFFCRVFSFEKWLPTGNFPQVLKKTFALIVVPLFFVLIFFGIYAGVSEHFASIFNNYEFEFDFWQMVRLFVLGFFIAFNFWNFAVEKFIYKQNHLLEDDFKEENKELKPTFDFIDLETERSSGVISLILLNILLVFLIVTYNYEQFYETVKTPYQLSQETHERVISIIISIIMVILVMMFYFKSTFNFDAKADLLKKLAKIWLFLNAVLIFSAIVTNTDYISSYGFTYKRLGVYAFLLLALIGLGLTFIKIQYKKKNAFLFNAMSWCFYGMVLVCSYFNWGGFITSQNMKRSDFVFRDHLENVWFSEKPLLRYAEKNKNIKQKNEILEQIKKNHSSTFLSKILYYETIQKQ